MQDQLNISIQEIESMDTPDFNNWFIGVSQGVALGLIAVSIT
ncbi:MULTISPECIES: daptide-type RiPP [unclassified Arthrobacter]|nr:MULTISPECIES: daptide-type RiPP [unclassified Arthrobacter]